MRLNYNVLSIVEGTPIWLTRLTSSQSVPILLDCVAKEVAQCH